MLAGEVADEDEGGDGDRGHHEHGCREAEEVLPGLDAGHDEEAEAFVFVVFRDGVSDGDHGGAADEHAGEHGDLRRAVFAHEVGHQEREAGPYDIHHGDGHVFGEVI